MTGKYSDAFKDKFQVGDVVDLKFGVALDQQICFLNTQEFYHKVYMPLITTLTLMKI